MLSTNLNFNHLPSTTSSITSLDQNLGLISPSIHHPPTQNPNLTSFQQRTLEQFGNRNLDHIDMTKSGKQKINQKKKRVTTMKKKIKMEREERRLNRVDALQKVLNPSEEIPTLPSSLIQNIVDMILEDEQQNEQDYEEALNDSIAGRSSRASSRHQKISGASQNSSRSVSIANQSDQNQSDRSLSRSNSRLSNLDLNNLTKKEKRKLKKQLKNESLEATQKQMISRSVHPSADRAPEEPEKPAATEPELTPEQLTEQQEMQKILHENVVNRLPVEFPGIHSRRFREYCNQVLDASLDQNIIKLIESVKRKQDKKIKENRLKLEQDAFSKMSFGLNPYQNPPVEVKKSIVMGLREVTKHAKAGNLKLVVIAPNLEKVKSKGGLVVGPENFQEIPGKRLKALT